jgi:hypothetical protein
MGYPVTEWKDRTVENPRTYTMLDNGDGTYTLIPAPGTVYEEGTPVSAALMNKIEQGIAAAVPKSGTNITDANALTEEGNYNVGATWTGSPHAGTNGANQGYLQHYQWSFINNMYALQVHTEVNANKLRRYRIKDNGVWQPWTEFITSEGGTITKSLILSRAGAQLKLTGANRDGGLFTSDDYIYLTDWETVSKGLRINMATGWAEVNDGTGWRPVGSGIQMGKPRTANLTTNGSNTWQTALDITGAMGRIERVSGNGFSGTLRVTIDGMMDEYALPSDSTLYFYVGHNINGDDLFNQVAAEDSIYFYNSLKIEIKSINSSSNVTAKYRLKAGTP